VKYSPFLIHLPFELLAGKEKKKEANSAGSMAFFLKWEEAGSARQKCLMLTAGFNEGKKNGRTLAA